MPAAREPSLAVPQIKRPEPLGGDPLHTKLILVALTFAAAWLRLSHLASKSLWLDEGATVALARASWQHFAWVWWHGEANLQTIYFLLMRAWIHFGLSEAWLRLPSALFGIATIPLLYAVAHKFMGATPALAAAALLAFSPTHVEYSQQARSYTLAILMVLAATYFFVAAIESGRRRDWALWTLVAILAFYSHDFAALVLAAQACSLFFKPKPAAWRQLILCGLVIFVCALPGLTYVLRASPENLHFVWMPRPSAKEFWHLAMFFGGGGAKIVVAFILWIAGVVAVLRSRSANTDAFWRGMLILLWAILPVVLIALVSLLHPMFLDRYMIFSLPAAILLAALGMSTLNKGRVGEILVVTLCAISIPTILAGYNKPREDWRGASNVVLSSATPGDAVVFFPFYTRVMLDYYRDRYPEATPAFHVYAPGYYAAGEDARNLIQALDANPRQFQHVWLLVGNSRGNPEEFDYGTSASGKLQSIFGIPQVRKFADVTVMKYGR